MISKKASENAEQIRPQVEGDTASATYYGAFKDIAAWMPKNSILSAEGAGTMDIRSDRSAFRKDHGRANK
jgi:hypothetical protein